MQSKYKLCKFNLNFVRRDQVLSSTSKIFYDCIVSADTIYIDCHSLNAIYLITCDKVVCSMSLKRCKN